MIKRQSEEMKIDERRRQLGTLPLESLFHPKVFIFFVVYEPKDKGCNMRSKVQTPSVSMYKIPFNPVSTRFSVFVYQIM